jgi:hypothetical protein
MFPAEVSAITLPGAARQGEGGVVPLLPPFFMGSIWQQQAGAAGGSVSASEEDDAAVAAAAHDRALAASRNHREAEKRRRERIKSHLDRLRNVLACDPKAITQTLLVLLIVTKKIIYSWLYFVQGLMHGVTWISFCTVRKLIGRLACSSYLDADTGS